MTEGGTRGISGRRGRSGRNVIFVWTPDRNLAWLEVKVPIGERRSEPRREVVLPKM